MEIQKEITVKIDVSGHYCGLVGYCNNKRFYLRVAPSTMFGGSMIANCLLYNCFLTYDKKHSKIKRCDQCIRDFGAVE